MIAIWSLNFAKITFWTMQFLEHFNLVIGVRNRLEFHQFIAAGSLFLSRPDPERSTHGNRRVPLNGSQFPETQTKARKAFDILALFKSLLGLENNSNF